MSGPRYVHDPRTHNRRAAELVVPWILERLTVRSVVDVGCGLGTWAAVFADHGCEVLGLEGEEVSRELLQIPPEHFRVVDLEGDVALPGRYDLAVCLEVAEHVSEPGGHRLVDLLTSAAETVLFSAAVPGQGGTNHVNEQWPAYWQSLFEARGFGVDDTIRWHFWQDDRIEWWYRQNMMLARRGAPAGAPMRPAVHPGLLARKNAAIDDLYHGRVPLRTGGIVMVRSVLKALGWRHGD